MSVLKLLRAGMRQQVQVGLEQIWHSFPAGAAPERSSWDPALSGPGGFGDMESFDEARLPPGAPVAASLGWAAETITYVLEGALSQADTTGRATVLGVGDFQRLTLGRDVLCTEWNASRTAWVHFIRISLRMVASPGQGNSEQRFISQAERRDQLMVVGSRDVRRHSLLFQQDLVLISAVLRPGHHLTHPLRPDRMAWLQVIAGRVQTEGLTVSAGDGLGLCSQRAISITSQTQSEILLIDLHLPIDVDDQAH